MKPQEKAIELIDKMYLTFLEQSVKQCALIVVDEILKNSINYNAYDGVDGNDIWSDNDYWIEVKKEIENI
jgi:hypothetical protein